MQSQGSFSWCPTELGWPGAQLSCFTGAPSSQVQPRWAPVQRAPSQSVSLGQTRTMRPCVMAASTAAARSRFSSGVLGMARRLCGPHFFRASKGPWAKPANSYRAFGRSASSAAPFGAVMSAARFSASAAAVARCPWVCTTVMAPMDTGLPTSHMTPKRYGGSESCTWPSATMLSQGSRAWSFPELGCPGAQRSWSAAEPSSHCQAPFALFQWPPSHSVLFGQPSDMRPSFSAPIMACRRSSCSWCVLGMAKRLPGGQALRAFMGPVKPAKWYLPASGGFSRCAGAAAAAASQMTPNWYGLLESCARPSAAMARSGSRIWLAMELGCPRAHGSIVAAVPSSHCQACFALFQWPPSHRVFFGQCCPRAPSLRASRTASSSSSRSRFVLGMTSRWPGPQACRALIGPVKPTKRYLPPMSKRFLARRLGAAVVVVVAGGVVVVAAVVVVGGASVVVVVLLVVVASLVDVDGAKVSGAEEVVSRAIGAGLGAAPPISSTSKSKNLTDAPQTAGLSVRQGPLPAGPLPSIHAMSSPAPQ
mmetsp:Transcript_78537/g.254409  ORF Transcript_78537/g.254409 Transcript_78537/m.254409 type:complete len:534 (+) Transcript_78537:144-1745(+)